MTDIQPLTPEERARVERLLASAERRKEQHKTASHRTVDVDGNPVQWEPPQRQLKGASASFYTRTTSAPTRAIDAIKNAPYEPWKPTPRSYGPDPLAGARRIILRATLQGRSAALASSDDLSLLDIAIIGACFEKFLSPLQLVNEVHTLRNNNYIRAIRIFMRVPRLVEHGYIEVGPKQLPPPKHQRRSR